MIIALLVCLYVMQANGVAIPTGCFMAAWLYLALYPVVLIVKLLLD